MRRPSLKIRITAWFALMMFVIEALVLSKISIIRPEGFL